MVVLVTSFPVLVLLLSITVMKCDWIEIPQVMSKRKSQLQSPFVLASPHSNLMDFPTTVSSLENNVLRKPTVMTTTVPTTPKNFQSKRKKVAQKTKYRNQTQVEEGEDGFLPFLNTIQHMLTSNSKRSFKGKLNLLKNLRDNLLVNIDEKMSRLWKRSDSDMARGHDDEHELDFPSNEGALMTIGFLTFAVYLIKIVLKLIYVIKYKANKGTTIQVVTTPTMTGRKKRQLEDSLEILRLINEFQVKNPV